MEKHNPQGVPKWLGFYFFHVMERGKRPNWAIKGHTFCFLLDVVDVRSSSSNNSNHKNDKFHHHDLQCELAHHVWLKFLNFRDCMVLENSPSLLTNLSLKREKRKETTQTRDKQAYPLSQKYLYPPSQG